MKKIIALALSIAIVLSFSAIAFAADVTLTDTNNRAGMGSGTDAQIVDTTYDSDSKTFKTTVANVDSQATLLVYPSAGLNTDNGTNIEYIDQEATASGGKIFTYKFKNDPTAGTSYKIKVGGTSVAAALYEDVIPEVAAATGFSITGTVDNAKVRTWTADDLDDLDGSDAINAAATINAASVTNVKAISFAELHLYVKSAFGSAVAPATIATGIVDKVSGAFSLTNVPNGEYAVIIERTGHLTRMIKVVVNNADVQLGNKDLFRGDVAGTRDFNITTADVGRIYANRYAYDDSRYSTNFDLNFDAQVNVADVGFAFANVSKSHAAYGEDNSIDVDDLLDV